MYYTGTRHCAMNVCWQLTFPGLTTPTWGDTENGTFSGTQNSNALGPWVGAAPLITALSSLASRGFVTCRVASLTAPMAVAAKVIALSCNSRGGSTPSPWTRSWKFLRRGSEIINIQCYQSNIIMYNANYNSRNLLSKLEHTCQSQSCR